MYESLFDKNENVEEWSKDFEDFLSKFRIFISKHLREGFYNRYLLVRNNIKNNLEKIIIN